MTSCRKIYIQYTYVHGVPPELYKIKNLKIHISINKTLSHLNTVCSKLIDKSNFFQIDTWEHYILIHSIYKSNLDL